MRNSKLFALVFFLWLATLLALTYYPNLPDVKVRIRGEWFRTDYMGHLAFYSGLIFFFLLWQWGRRRPVRNVVIFLAVGTGLLLGAVTEGSQYYIPGRSVNPIDLMYNCIGIISGAAVFWIFVNKKVSGRMNPPPVPPAKAGQALPDVREGEKGGGLK